MKPVGSVFKLKASFDTLRNELVPSFDLVLEDWINNVKRTNFSDPNYVLEITYITPPLKTFIERIIDRLNTPGCIVGAPLERGFGFGKTHALIFLWHLFTSNIYRNVSINIDESLVRETLVLGIDCSKDRPFVKLIEELKVYTDIRHPIAHIKDPLLLRSVTEVLRGHERDLYTLSSEELAKIIAEMLEEYRRQAEDRAYCYS